MANEIKAARKVIRDAFESDPEFKYTYIANVAVILSDNFETRYDITDQVAEQILDRIFSA